MAYKSNVGRDPMAPSKEVLLKPGPGQYDPKKPVNKLIRGKVKENFGTSAARDNLLFRDVAVAPFNNPSNMDNPSP